MFCSNCGTQNSDGGLFCSKCGTAIGVAAEDTRFLMNNHKNPTPEKTKKPTKKGRHIKRNLALVCLTVLLMAGSSIAAGWAWSIPGWTWMNSDTRLVEKQLTLGEKYLADSKYEKAITAYKKVIEIDSKKKEAFIGLADAYLGLDDTSNSENALTEGIEAIPKEDDLYIKLASFYLDEKDEDAAVALLETGYEKTGSNKIKSMLEKQFIVVPRFIGKNYLTEVQGNSEYKDFSIETKESQDSSADAGYVLAQDIPTGTRINEKEKIVLTIAVGKKEQVDVPNFSNIGVYPVIVSNALWLERFTFVEEPVYSDEPVGTIISQSIPAGTKVVKGSEITLQVSRGVETISLPPDIVGMDYDVANTLLTGIGFVCSKIDMKNDGTKIANTVSEVTTCSSS